MKSGGFEPTVSEGKQQLTYAFNCGHWDGRDIYRTIISPVVLYGCETWSPPLRKEHWLRVFQNRVLRRLFRPKRDDVTGEWRKLYNEVLNDLYYSPNIIRVIKLRRMRWAGQGHIVSMGERRGVNRVLVGKPEGKRPLGRHRDGRIILRWIFRKWDVGTWTGSTWLKIGTGGEHL
jgi:hypothetical protein